MSTSKASGKFEGSLKEGRGTMKPAHAPEIPFGVASRFEGAAGSNPEELIGAALAGCFSMALTANLGRAGFEPRSVETDASVELVKGDGGFEITSIALTTRAKVAEIDAAKFQEIAEQTKKTCPVSKALAGPRITLDASLA
jgi:osmotically inducible protein OsmC